MKDNLGSALNGRASNPQDPLWKNAPERVAHLTRRFAAEAHQYSAQDVINAAAGILVTALRQSHSSRQEVEARYDEIFGRMKGILLSHYDASGRLKGVFPFDQRIEAPLVIDKVRSTPE